MNATSTPRFYSISSSTSGATLGVYLAQSPAAALDAMAQDAGYRDAADAAQATGDDGAHLVVEEMRYSVVVVSPNLRHADASPIVERDCGHEHKSLATAEACRNHLARRYPDGSYSARWWRAEVRHADGSALTGDEHDALETAVFEINNRRA